ncbi:MAG: FadR family transcriptional regulator [Chloroflexi bacterium]|nr:FadR family transcriptional regulator [Chloroflexota bacterium]
MPPGPLGSALLRYIIERQVQPGERLPTIPELSVELGVSVGKVREELEVARTLGLVQIKPRTGSVVQPFDFTPAATLGVLYAIGLDPAYFHTFADLRKHLELSYWTEAVACLTPDDIDTLRALNARAVEKLNRLPIEVPVEEHARLHLTFYRHLENTFVQGLLSAYWAAYMAFGVALHAPLTYHREMWTYHEQMVECVARGDYEGGRRALREHMELLRHAPETIEQGARRVIETDAKAYRYIFSVFE